MKKIYAFLLAWVLGSTMLLYARTVAEAEAIAKAFFDYHEMTPTRRIQKAERIPNNSRSVVQLAFTQYQSNTILPAVYVYNNTDRTGFVLVSAVDEGRPILGYADKGSFDKTNIPSNMQFWLQMYANELAQTISSQGSTILLETPNMSVNIGDTFPVIAPILEEVKWGQGAPYNDLCPEINGEISPVGCVATAMAQIMYVHKFPKQGTGSHSYVSSSYKLNLNANFALTTYAWDKMLPNYAGEYTDEQKEAVATLMSHLGIAVDMDYTPLMSLAYSTKAMKALINYFGYDKGISFLPKYYMSEYEILSSISKELQAGRPIFLEGSTANLEGHAFVCDGMQSNGFLHINWGWDGNCNGYFALSALAPDSHGIGGSSTGLAFTDNIAAYIGISPAQGGEWKPFMTASSIKYTSADKIHRTKPATITLSYLHNCGVGDAIGKLNYFIYNAEDSLISILPLSSIKLASRNYQTYINLSKVIPMELPAGEYTLEVAFTDNLDEKYPIRVKNQGVVRIPMILSEDTISFQMQAESKLNPIERAQIVYLEDKKQWQLIAYSKDFMGTALSETDQVIQCYIYSASNTSIIGTYTTESYDIPGAINSALYGVGIQQLCTTYLPTILQMTILPAENDMLQLEYYMEVNGKIHQQKCLLTPVWYMQSGSEYVYYDSEVTYGVAATLSISNALNILSKNSVYEKKQMSYLVSGTVTDIYQTPYEIMKNKCVTFDISNDDTYENALHCSNTRWLQNTDFITGEEIEIGNGVIVYGTLQNESSDTSGISGYIYEFSEIPIIQDYNIKKLELISVQNLNVTFNWVSNATMVQVRIVDSNRKQVYKGNFTEQQVTIIVPKYDTYTVYVRAINEDGHYLGLEEKLVVCVTSLEDVLPKNTLYLYDLMGRIVDVQASDILRGWSVPTSGIYIIRSTNKYQQVYIK